MLLNGLLGVSKKDLFLDYELSFLAESGCRDNAQVGDMVNKFKKMFDYIETFGEEGDSFSQCVENYMLSIGLSQKTIDSIKSNMLE